MLHMQWITVPDVWNELDFYLYCGSLCKILVLPDKYYDLRLHLLQAKTSKPEIMFYLKKKTTSSLPELSSINRKKRNYLFLNNFKLSYLNHVFVMKIPVVWKHNNVVLKIIVFIMKNNLYRDIGVIINFHQYILVDIL